MVQPLSLLCSGSAALAAAGLLGKLPLAKLTTFQALPRQSNRTCCIDTYTPPKSWSQQAAPQNKLCMLGSNGRWAEGTGELPFHEAIFPSLHWEVAQA